MHTLQSILSSKNRNCGTETLITEMIPLSLTLGLRSNWRLENLAVSQQAEAHSAVNYFLCPTGQK